MGRLLILVILALVAGCSNPVGSSGTEKLQFVDLRLGQSTSLAIIDDSVSQSTKILFNGNVVLDTTWIHGIYGGPLIKTRLFWAKSKDNFKFVLVGFSDLSYHKLIIIKPDGTVKFRSIDIITLLDSELRNNTEIWFSYNESNVRSGSIANVDTVIAL